MTDFSVYLVSIGSDEYQLFIKNNCSDTDFVRIIIGCSYMRFGKRVANVLSSFIVSPLQPTSEKVFLRQINRHQFVGKRIWVAFEPVKRRGPVKAVANTFIAVSTTASSWRRTIGSETSLKFVKNSAPRGQIEELIRLSEAGTGSSILLRGA